MILVSILKNVYEVFGNVCLEKCNFVMISVGMYIKCLLENIFEESVRCEKYFDRASN